MAGQQLPTLHRLVNQLRHVPYLASKNVYRVALYLLQADQQKIEQLCATILQARQLLKHCVVCCNWTESAELCDICQSAKRDSGTVCVVETWHDLLAIEQAGSYHGVYHVLGGALSPLEGIGPEHLSIQLLLQRIATSSIKEVIFATNPTPEGEATASFITSKIDKNRVMVSRLASGMPTGASLEFVDRITIYKAMVGRIPF
jgi:recombination protein RecR